MFNTSEIDSQVQFICTIESICQIELQKRVISIYNRWSDVRKEEYIYLNVVWPSCEKLHILPHKIMQFLL